MAVSNRGSLPKVPPTALHSSPSLGFTPLPLSPNIFFRFSLASFCLQTAPTEGSGTFWGGTWGEAYNVEHIFLRSRHSAYTDVSSPFKGDCIRKLWDSPFSHRNQALRLNSMRGPVGGPIGGPIRGPVHRSNVYVTSLDASFHIHCSSNGQVFVPSVQPYMVWCARSVATEEPVAARGSKGF